MKKILAILLALSLMLMTAAFAAEGSSQTGNTEVSVTGNVSTNAATYNTGADASQEGFRISWNVQGASGHNSNTYHWEPGFRRYVRDDVRTTWYNVAKATVAVSVINYGTRTLYVSNRFDLYEDEYHYVPFQGARLTDESLQKLWNNREIAGFNAEANFAAYGSATSALSDLLFSKAEGDYEISVDGLTAGTGETKIGTFTVYATYTAPN